jgi:hypothetical protein
MALFRKDSISLCCSDVGATKQWWGQVFDCKEVKMPNWDDPLPSDVALRLPGAVEPTILLSNIAEVRQAGLERSNGRPIIFSDKLKKAHEYLCSRGVAAGPIQDGGDTQFFEIRDPEGNVIEICKEP